tara:strand:- start:542 stop:724 length:183 start_codon:yes stop_codon:yes gene_type:complete
MTGIFLDLKAQALSDLIWLALDPSWNKRSTELEKQLSQLCLKHWFRETIYSINKFKSVTC